MKVILSLIILCISISCSEKGINITNMPGTSTTNANGNSSENISRACTTQPANSTGGTENSSNGGGSWSSCTGFSCNINYLNISNICTLSNQTRACTSQPSNSTGGTESSTDGGVTWGSCSGYSCNASYTNIAGVCTLTNQTRSCTTQPSNSTGGTESSSDAGLTWSSCSGYSCNASYTNVGGICTLTNQTRSCLSQPANSTGGTESSSDAGSTWSSCGSFTCNTGYTSNGTSCIINTYSITVTKLANRGTIIDSSFAKINCTVNCTSETQSYDYSSLIILDLSLQVGYTVTSWSDCDSTSLSETRCTISSISTNRNPTPTISCDTGYMLVGGNCVLTNQSQSCSITNGTGTQSSTDGGQTWGVCTVQSCNANYSASVSNLSCESTIIQTDQSFSMGIDNSCILMPDSNLYCWGYNGFGAVGNNSNTDTSVPFLIDMTGVLSGKTITKVSVGDTSSCGIGNDNKAYCWGNNSNGQLGDGTTTTSSVPVAVNTAGVLAGKTILDIQVGSYYACAIASDNQVYCWGWNGHGQLGDGSIIEHHSPVAVDTTGVLAGKTVLQLTTGLYSACVIASDYKVYCWGKNGFGELGDNTVIEKHSPVAVDTSGVLSGKTIRQISGVVDDSFCVIANDLKIYCWGRNDSGQLGNNAWVDSHIPVAVDMTGILSGETIKSISVGTHHSCALTNSNKISCWGAGFNGELGNIAVSPSPVPVLTDMSAALFGKTITSIHGGGLNMCAISSDPNLYCWGANTSAQVGIEYDYSQHNLPFLSGTTIRKSCTITNGKGIQNSTNKGSTWSSCVPSSCNAGYITSLDGTTCESIIISHITNYSSSAYIACGITNIGNPYCWGWNGTGGVGDGTWTTSYSALPVITAGALAGKTILHISVGIDHVCAIASDNKPYCWGSNIYGQLGNNSFTDSNVPVAVDMTGVLSGKTILQISSGDSSTCVIASDNKPYCWGANVSGELGNNTLTNSSIPVAVDMTGVLSGKTILQISSNNLNSCVIASDYKPYCWGDNAHGQLGNNSVVANSQVPVAVDMTGVLSGKTLRQISGHTSDTFCVIANDNKPYCWGLGGDGNLGNNTWADSKIPVAVSMTGVLSGKLLKGMETSYFQSCAYTNSNTAVCWGRGSTGQLGNNGTSASAVPSNVTMSGSLFGKTISNITTSGPISCAETIDNQLHCWGMNNYSQFDSSSQNQSNVPIILSTGFSF